MCIKIGGWNTACDAIEEPLFVPQRTFKGTIIFLVEKGSSELY